METYEAILERMRVEYEKKSGSPPEDASDLGLRLQILAGELYRLQGKLDWLKRQAFPHTARGVQLDLHGAQRGVKRRGALRARGTLVFSRYIPLERDLAIPKGALCATSGQGAVEYETTEERVLPAGETSVSIPAQALEAGAAGNAAAGCIGTLASVLPGVNAVTNPAAFTGGADPEEDEAYRRRMLAAYGRVVQCGNAAYYEELALARPEVASAQAVPRENGPGTVGVYVWGPGGPPSQELLDSLSQELEALREVGAAVSVKAAAAKKVNIGGFIKVLPGAVYAGAEAKAKEALAEWFAQRRIGDPVYLGDLSRVLLRDPAVCGVTFAAVTKDVPGAAGVVPVLGSVALGNSA
ncbi:baseplate J/gp47 family protein [Acutalibacter sp.]|uniref:baseplate J/gp47 family protein n=1 Tax=Acutalibacter sp. TaxID=1918636 RepID=UPI00216C6CE6|nr:baseplate protein J [Acutalibacter sp.]